MEMIIGMLALLATFYQLYLQRVHSEKSLRPLGQIDFRDKGRTLRVSITNNGIGPLIVEKIIYTKNEKKFDTISDCLTLDPITYAHLQISESVRAVIHPDSSLVVFDTTFEPHGSDNFMGEARIQLSNISMEVVGKDIFNNKVSIQRVFKWFAAREK